MDKSLYDTLQEIYEEKKNDFSKDIKLIATLSSEEDSPNGKVIITNDVFVIVDEMPNGDISQRFIITGRSNDGKIYPAEEFAQDDLSFLAQFQNAHKVDVVSLSDLDRQLDNIANKLGVKKEDIRSMSEVDLDRMLDENDLSKAKSRESYEKDDFQKTDEVSPSQDILNDVTAKQEINMDVKVDEKYTLADILGVPAGSKLVVVYPTNIPDKSNLPYTTSLVCMIKNPDGSLEYSDVLTQVGGKDSNKNVYEVNRDGSSVQEKSVKSSFAVKSNIVKNGIITARIGSMGYIEVGFGYMDRTSHRDVISEKLEDERTRYTTYEVRREFSQKKGIDKVPEMIDEINEHQKHNEHTLTLDEADGDPSTGHQDILEKIKAHDENIGDIFTDQEIISRYHSICEKYPEADPDTLLEYAEKDLSEDAEHLRSH